MAKLYMVFLVLFGVIILSCSSGQQSSGPSLDEDLAAIAEAREALLGALESDDVEGIIRVLTDDHFTMPPGANTPPDNVALAGWHQTRIDRFRFNTEFTTDDIQVRGDIAIERWSSDIRLLPKDVGEPVEDDGKGVWIWERQGDGTWKLLWSIWNSNLPASALI